MSRHTLSRRRFLGGAGTLLTLPFLEGLAPWSRALATTPDTPPNRVLFYFVPNGIRMEEYKPTIPGPNWESTNLLSPLEPHRDELLILSGLANKAWVADDAPHTHASGTFLTCTPIEKIPGGQVIGGISADQVAANAVGHLTRFPSLEVSADDDWLGFCEEGYSCGYLQSISWASPKTPLPTISDPAKLFDRLFAGWNPDATALEIAQRKAEKKSVLDYVLAQAGALHNQLGYDDRLRMDEYMEGIYELEKAIETYGQFDVDPNMCPDPVAPLTASNHPMRVELLTDLMLLAFRCDQTRIITFMLENGFGARYYDFLDVAQDHHSLTHHFGNEDMIADVITINHWEITQFAMLIEKMKNIQEGDGTLLDHTAVMFSSSMSDGNLHSPYDLPVVLAGRAGGAISPGRHVVFENEPPRADLYIALMAMLGVQVDSFGTHGTQPLDGLTA
ncbi:MAG: DUF1552 domain-containing protein [Myxococcota bacterium]|nr:DUF1552 domain-containing protein [Myxococcota bacterium]